MRLGEGETPEVSGEVGFKHSRQFRGALEVLGGVFGGSLFVLIIVCFV